jgi:hypothetical protein
MKIDRLKNMKEHLKTQIKTAKGMGSKWVYILTTEAERCLELAEAEDTLMAEQVPAELEGGGSSWWYVCGECHTAIDPKDKFCRECGRRILWGN